MEKGKSKITRYLRYILLDVIIAAVVSILLITYVASAYRIEGDSMLTVLHDKERIIISKLGVNSGSIHRGDIVVLKKPDDPGKSIIKRIIGLPGERFEIKKGDVFINGIKLDEPYLTQEKDIIFRSLQTSEIEIPEGHYFVLGDNRTVSQDSRYFGPIPKDFIFGKTIFRYWPLSKLGKVD